MFTCHYSGFFLRSSTTLVHVLLETHLHTDLFGGFCIPSTVSLDRVAREVYIYIYCRYVYMYMQTIYPDSRRAPVLQKEPMCLIVSSFLWSLYEYWGGASCGNNGQGHPTGSTSQTYFRIWLITLGLGLFPSRESVDPDRGECLL